MTWEQVLAISIGPLIGLLGVCLTIMRNYHLSERARNNRLHDDKLSIAAALYAELHSAKLECLARKMAFLVKKERYMEKGANPETAQQKAETSLRQYLPNIDRTVFEHNANSLGVLGPNAAASVSRAYSAITLVRTCFLERDIQTNQDVANAIDYLDIILHRSEHALNNALHAIAPMLPSEIKNNLLAKDNSEESLRLETTSEDSDHGHGDENFTMKVSGFHCLTNGSGSKRKY